MCHTGKVRIEPNKLKESATKTVFHVHLLDEPKASRTPYCMSMPCHRLKGGKIFKSRFYVVEYSGYPIAKAGLIFKRLLNWPFDGPFYYCFEKLFLP